MSSIFLRIMLLLPMFFPAFLGWVPGRDAASPAIRSIAVPNVSSGEPRFTFSVLSDIHITPWDGESHRRLRQALSDHAALFPQSSLMALNGDLTNGNDEDYRSLFKLLGETPHAPVQAAMGNHEYYRIWRTPDGGMDTSKLHPAWSSEKAVRLFTSYFGYEKPYHDLWLHGFHFIFLGGEAYRDAVPGIGDDAFLSGRQLQWLEKKLAQLPPKGEIKGAKQPENRQPVFVFLHQPLPRTVDGTDHARGVVQEKALRSLLDRHPEAILFSGHTHWDLERTKQIKRLSFLAVGSSSVRQVFNRRDEPEINAKSQSLAVEVFDRRIVIRGRDHASKRWIEPAYTLTW